MASAEQRNWLRSLGAQARKFRIARGMRQEDVAAALGLSVAYVSLIERGRRNPPITTVIALAGVLRASPAELLVVCTEAEQTPTAAA